MVCRHVTVICGIFKLFLRICWIVPKKYLLLLDQTILIHFRSSIDRPLNLPQFPGSNNYFSIPKESKRSRYFLGTITIQHILKKSLKIPQGQSESVYVFCHVHKLLFAWLTDNIHHIVIILFLRFFYRQCDIYFFILLYAMKKTQLSCNC
jgi:hypothetical protein